MAIGLTQSEMDSHAGQMLVLLPSEPLTYRRSGAEDIELTGHIPQFSGYERMMRLSTMDPALINQRKCRIPVSALPMEPKTRDAIERSDGSVWDVDLVDGGPGRPWWTLTIRRVR